MTGSAFRARTDWESDLDLKAHPAFDSLLCELVRGVVPPRPVDWSESEEDAFIEAAAIHGVHHIAARALQSADDWPSSLKQRLAQWSNTDKAVEVLQRSAIATVVAALGREGIRPVLLKGTALAYSLYPSPVLRPRADIDLLIRPRDRDAVFTALNALGYAMRMSSGGTHISRQRCLERTDRFGVLHSFDIHWEISNSPMFCSRLEYGELLERAVPLPGIGDNCLGVARLDGLLHACLHRVSHRFSPYYLGDVSHYGDRLIWLYDIHLLVESLSPSERKEFVARARERGLAMVCSDGIREAAACFDSTGAAELLSGLETGGAREPTAALLTAGPERRFMLELGSLPDTRARIAFLREHLFPPGQYMRERYGVRHSALLPLFYLRRGLSGAWKRLYNPPAN